VGLEPERFGAWLNLGRVCVELGDRAAARAALQRALALRPDDAVARRELQALER
jgi:cytochrome c-type biogenesis protein CcmH/NrfG